MTTVNACGRLLPPLRESTVKVRREWLWTARGTLDGWRNGSWEVTCEACGDDLGPRVTQNSSVAALRGPFAELDDAERAQQVHLKAHKHAV